MLGRSQWRNEVVERGTNGAGAQAGREGMALYQYHSLADAIPPPREPFRALIRRFETQMVRGPMTSFTRRYEIEYAGRVVCWQSVIQGGCAERKDVALVPPPGGLETRQSGILNPKQAKKVYEE